MKSNILNNTVYYLQQIVDSLDMDNMGEIQELKVLIERVKGLDEVFGEQIVTKCTGDFFLKRK